MSVDFMELYVALALPVRSCSTGKKRTDDYL
jgi:hypothetical protein